MFGINAGKMLVFFIILYFVIKWGVKNGIKGFYSDEKDKSVKENIVQKNE